MTRELRNSLWILLLLMAVLALAVGTAAAEDAPNTDVAVEPVCPEGWRDTSVGSMKFCSHPDIGARGASDAWLLSVGPGRVDANPNTWQRPTVYPWPGATPDNPLGIAWAQEFEWECEALGLEIIHEGNCG